MIITCNNRHSVDMYLSLHFCTSYVLTTIMQGLLSYKCYNINLFMTFVSKSKQIDIKLLNQLYMYKVEMYMYEILHVESSSYKPVISK